MHSYNHYMNWPILIDHKTTEETGNRTGFPDAWTPRKLILPMGFSGSFLFD